jgi:iron(III) transport system permease protein
VITKVRLGDAALSLLTAAVLLVLIVYPLLSILLQGFIPGLFNTNPNFAPTLDYVRNLFTDPTNLQALVNSVLMGLAVAGGASLIAVPVAFLTARTDMPFRGVVSALVWVVFFTPSFVMASAWLVLVSTGGIIDQVHPLPSFIATNFFSIWGVIFILSMKLFPFVYLSMRAGLAGLGSEFSDAARTLGSGPWRAFLRVDLPLLLPALLAGAIIVFAEAISDFGTVATIAQQSGFPLLTYQIYASISTAPVNFPQAAALALFLILAIALAMLVQSLMLRRRGYAVLTGRIRPARTVRLKLWKVPALCFCAFVFIMALVAPLTGAALTATMKSVVFGYVPSNFTSQNFSSALAVGSSNIQALQRSVVIALIAGTVVSLGALPLAYAMEMTQMAGRRLLSLLTLTTIAIPGIVLAAGYIFAWNQPWQARAGFQFYGTIQLLTVALIAGALPYAIRLYVGGLSQVHGTLVDAARVQGAGIWRTLAFVVFPLLRRQVGSIWMLVFTGTMFELAAAELLYPPGQPTMPVMILTLLGNFQTGIAMALTLMSIGVLAAALILARGLFWVFSMLIWKQRGTPQVGLMVENVDTPTLEAQAHA